MMRKLTCRACHPPRRFVRKWRLPEIGVGLRSRDLGSTLFARIGSLERLPSLIPSMRSLLYMDKEDHTIFVMVFELAGIRFDPRWAVPAAWEGLD